MRLLNGLIAYHERKGHGLYQFDEREIRNLISCYKKGKDYCALETTLKELFHIANEGRRPWSLAAEEAFLKLTVIGCELLTYLRSVHRVSSETYRSIGPLSLVQRLEYEAERMQDWEDGEGGHRRDHTLDIFYRLTNLNILIFDQWATDYPEAIELPSLDALRSVLQIDDENDYRILLSALAKTRRSDVNTLLLELVDDEESEVRLLARRLQYEYFTRQRPSESPG